MCIFINHSAGNFVILPGPARTKLDDPCLKCKFLEIMTFRVRMGKKGHFEQIFFIINFLEFKSVIQPNLMTFGVFEKLFNYQNRVHYHIFQSVITFFLFVRLKTLFAFHSSRIFSVLRSKFGDILTILKRLLKFQTYKYHISQYLHAYLLITTTVVVWRHRLEDVMMCVRSSSILYTCSTYLLFI